MKILYTACLILVILFGCENPVSDKDTTVNLPRLELSFPAEPQENNESTTLNGKNVGLTIKSLSLDSSVFILYQIEFKEAVDNSAQVQKEFFSGFLSYILGDLGLSLGEMSSFKERDQSGYNFEIKVPRVDLTDTTIMGKALWLGNQANVWFALDFNQNSGESTTNFLNNYSIK